MTRILFTCILLLLLCGSSRGITVVSDSLTQANGAPAVHCWVHGWWTHIEGATWIWKEYQVQHPDQRESVVFSRTFWTPWAPAESRIEMAADNFFEVYINDSLVASSQVYENFRLVRRYYVARFLIPGYNKLKIVVTNGPIEGTVPPQNPAGLIYKVYIPEPLHAQASSLKHHGRTS